MLVVRGEEESLLRENGSKSPVSINIETATIERCILGAIAIVWALGVFRVVWAEMFGGALYNLMTRIDLDRETSIATYLSTLLLVAAAILAYICGRASRVNDPLNFRHWMILSVVFVYLSIDENIGLHEVSIEPMREMFGLSGVFTFGWVLLAIPVVMLLGLYYIPFLLRLPRQLAATLCVAGGLFVFGAIGVEMLGASFYTTSNQTLVYRMFLLLEEGLEMIGVAIFLIALLRYLAPQKPSLVLGGGA